MSGSINAGERVSTPLGPGVVVFVRNAAPDFCKPEAISVKLDALAARAGYVGTMLPAGAVSRSGSL